MATAQEKLIEILGKGMASLADEFEKNAKFLQLAMEQDLNDLDEERLVSMWTALDHVQKGMGIYTFGCMLLGVASGADISKVGN